ncbi:MAG: hypothetical protein WC516_04915 [Patescibacteria group bacterium]
MKIDQIFENVPESTDFNIEAQELLNKIMAIKNPMDFDDDFATDIQLEALEDEMDRLESRMSKLLKFIDTLKKIKASESNKPTFI